MSKITNYKEVIMDAAANAIAMCVYEKADGTLCVCSFDGEKDAVRRFVEVLNHFNVEFKVEAVTSSTVPDDCRLLIRHGVWYYE